MEQFEYAAPGSIEQAVRLLGGRQAAVALAGGQSVVPDLRLGRRRPSLLVDLRRLAELRVLGAENGAGWRVGALTTLSALADGDALAAAYPALAEAARAVGDQQVRNRSTVGGGLMNGRVGADLPPALVALDASVETARVGGPRVLPVETALAGLPPGEIVVAVRLPATGAGWGSAYEKLRDPASLYAVCGVAASLRAGADGRVAACRVAVTGIGPGVVRLPELESNLTGWALAVDGLSSQVRAAAAGLDCLTDLRASGEYRRHLVAVLGERALRRALERAGLSTN